MKLILADAMGLCFGVRDAIAATRNLPRPTDITIFGQLVHNPLVSQNLQSRGFSILDESQRSAASIQTSAVLITAHGISNHERARLKTQGKSLIDTTCPLVRRAHDAALTLARDGYFVVVIGKPGHVEVRGLTGDLDPDRHAIVETPEQARPYPGGKIGIIAQTTTAERDAHAIVQSIREQNGQADVKFINTICQPTRDRQRALERLLEQINILVVVGGKHSNNTKQLVAHAREKGVPAIHIESAAELHEEMFHPTNTVGLTAGTSTLPETIDAVRQKLERFFTDTTVDRVFSANQEPVPDLPHTCELVSLAQLSRRARCSGTLTLFEHLALEHLAPPRFWRNTPCAPERLAHGQTEGVSKSRDE